MKPESEVLKVPKKDQVYFGHSYLRSPRQFRVEVIEF